MYLVLCDGYFTDYCDYGNVLRASVVQQISVFYNFTGKDTEKREKRTKNTAPFQPEKLSASVHTAWEDAAKKTKAKGYYLSIPQDSTETISLFLYPSHRQFYNLQNFSYDRNSGTALSGNSTHAQSFEKADFATKVRKLNYDLHVGSALGGIWGRILYFLLPLSEHHFLLQVFGLVVQEKKKLPNLTILLGK